MGRIVDCVAQTSVEEIQLEQSLIDQVLVKYIRLEKKLTEKIPIDEKSKNQ